MPNPSLLSQGPEKLQGGLRTQNPLPPKATSRREGPHWCLQATPKFPADRHQDLSAFSLCTNSQAGTCREGYW